MAFRFADQGSLLVGRVFIDKCISSFYRPCQMYNFIHKVNVNTKVLKQTRINSVKWCVCKSTFSRKYKYEYTVKKVSDFTRMSLDKLSLLEKILLMPGQGELVTSCLGTGNSRTCFYSVLSSLSRLKNTHCCSE
jgi:hypothetical protein